MSKRLIFSLIIIFTFIHVHGQIIYESGFPTGLSTKQELRALPHITTSVFSPSDLKSKAQCKGCKVMPIGKVFRYKIDFKKTAMRLRQGGEQIWYLRISSPVGKAISLTFSGLHIPREGKLFIYATDGSYSFGPITFRNNKRTGILPTRYFPSQDLIIEYHEPLAAQSSDFLIRDIIVYTKLFGESEPCEVNINCPAGAAWQTQKHAVAKIIFTSGISQYLCTGALVGNTAMNREPYFLTANHCISKDKEAESAVFYFNYESTDCDGQNILPEQTVSGSALIATGESQSGKDHLDFTLLRLSAMPPRDYEPYLAGWSRVSDTLAIDSSICIHHPSGDIKKISKDLNHPGIASFSGYDDNTHWHIYRWDLGSTEGGSSGSPLFDQNKRIIGDLTGGEASCDDDVNDYFAQFYQSWDKYSDTLMQLRHWLDPLGQNPTYIDGYDPYQNYVYLPPVDKVFGYEDDSLVKIHWLPPDYSGDSLFYDGFEKYRDFALSFPNWTQVDKDQGVTWGIEGVQFDNENYVGSFIVFDPEKTDPPNPTGWRPHQGKKMLVCFSSQPPNNPNNDWLISQKFTCTDKGKLVFYARSVTDSFGLERIRVLVSDKSSQTRDFVPLSPEPYVQVPVQWTRFEYDLGRYAGKQIYVAINVVSDNSFALLLDDISITDLPSQALKNCISSRTSSFGKEKSVLLRAQLPHYKSPSLIGYKIFRDYQQIATVDTSQLYFVDHADLPATYYVVASYSDGDAAASPQIKIQLTSDSLTAFDRDNAVHILPNPVTNGHFRVVLNHPVSQATLSMYNIYGQKVFRQSFDNVKEKEFYLPYLQSGMYIMELRVMGESYKTLFIVL